MSVEYDEIKNTNYHFYERAFVDYDGHLIALYEIATSDLDDQQKGKN